MNSTGKDFAVLFLNVLNVLFLSVMYFFQEKYMCANPVLMWGCVPGMYLMYFFSLFFIYNPFFIWIIVIKKYTKYTEVSKTQ